MSKVKHSPLYRLDLYEKGKGAEKGAMPIRSIDTTNKDRLKSRGKKLADRFDVLGPYQIHRDARLPLPPVTFMKSQYQERRAAAEAIQKRKLGLDKLQSPSLETVAAVTEFGESGPK